MPSTACEEAILLPTLLMRQRRPGKVQPQESSSGPASGPCGGSMFMDSFWLNLWFQSFVDIHPHCSLHLRFCLSLSGPPPPRAPTSPHFPFPESARASASYVSLWPGTEWVLGKYWHHLWVMASLHASAPPGPCSLAPSLFLSSVPDFCCLCPL